MYIKITDELLDEQRVDNCIDRPYLIYLLREESKRFSSEIKQLKDRIEEMENTLEETRDTVNINIGCLNRIKKAFSIDER